MLPPSKFLLLCLVVYFVSCVQSVGTTCCRGFNRIEEDGVSARSSAEEDSISSSSSSLPEDDQSSTNDNLKRVKRRTYKLPEEALANRLDSEEESQDELEIRLEYIKRQILHKLGMSKVPKVRRKVMDSSVYQPLLELQNQLSPPQSASTSFNQNPSSSPSTDDSDKLFIFPVKKTPYGATFNVTINSNRSPYPIRKISLFVKQKSTDGLDDEEITLIAVQTSSNGTTLSERVVNVVRPDSGSHAKHHQTQEDNTLRTSSPWKEYNLTEALFESSLISPDSIHNPLLLAVSKSRKIYSSFITVEYDYVVTTRSKRSIDCSASGNSSSCCREQFYVNFTHIHWDNWIIQPTGYYANYCKGKCDISHARYHHTTVVQKYQSLVNLCCSPREMSHIPLIYIDEAGYVLKKVLLNMVVESCDCA